MNKSPMDEVAGYMCLLIIVVISIAILTGTMALIKYGDTRNEVDDDGVSNHGSRTKDRAKAPSRRTNKGKPKARRRRRAN